MPLCVTSQLKKVTLLLGILVCTAYADPKLEGRLQPVTIGQAADGAWFRCPCFRYVTSVIGPSGSLYIRREFLISSEGVIQFRNVNTYDYDSFQARTYNAGQFDFLWVPGRLGFGSNGGSWGDDLDKGDTLIRKFEFHALANALLKRNLRLDFKTGIETEHKLRNTLPVERQVVTELATFKWMRSRSGDYGGWSGEIQAHVGQNLDHFDDKDFIRAGVSALTGYIFNVHDFLIGLSLNLFFLKDGWEKALMATDAREGRATLQLSFGWQFERGEAPRQ